MMAFALYLALCFLAAWIAGYRGRSAFGIFMLSLLVTPLIGIIVALVLEKKLKPVRPSYDQWAAAGMPPVAAKPVNHEARFVWLIYATLIVLGAALVWVATL